MSSPAGNDRSFEVVVDCGASEQIVFEMTVEWLRGDRDVRIRAILASDEGDERTRLRTAAWAAVRRMIDRNLEEPVTVTHDYVGWIVPAHAIRFVRLRDPAASGKRGGQIGFTLRPDDGAGGE